MKTVPFVFGKTAEGDDFTDREEESLRLSQNFASLTHTIIISPRRWGKSSLVKKVARDHVKTDKKARVCQIDLFNVRSEGEFYEQLAVSVVKGTSDKFGEWLSTAKEMLAHLRPQITISPGMQEDLSFDIEWSKIAKKPDEVLDLAEQIAQAKGLRLIVCIDEFQNIASFDDPLAFQRKLRSHWQHHQRVGYCLYGSKRHMMLEIFSEPSMPFYRFGDLMLLGKISTGNWAEYISRRFSDSGKTISLSDAAYLAELMDNHSYYVQQLAQQSWLRTPRRCTREIVDAALSDIKNQLGLLFTNITDSLSNKQIGFLHAVVSGEEHFSSEEVLREYGIGTSGGVRRIKEALLKKEVLDMTGSKIEFLDPVYKYWLTTDYFR
jgi:hypothetical protein